MNPHQSSSPAGNMSARSLADQIARKLAGPLPGPPAQLTMVPRSESGVADRGAPPGEARKSGVILLLFDGESDTEIVLTLRSDNLQHHGNQLSLPGGRLEHGESVTEAALRETHEEVGIDPASIRILGRLTPLHVPVSGNVIHPVVGWLDTRPVLIPDHREVAEAFTLPLRTLFDAACIRSTRRDLRGTVYEIPYWDVHRVPLWGATAMILSEFCVLIRDIVDDARTG
jgi:8-oxo-dGTP pyrophosphatase MutT (NUDIX family)